MVRSSDGRFRTRLVFQTRPSPPSCAKPAQPDIGSLAVFRPNKSKRSATHPHIWLALMRKCWIILFATVLGYDTFSGKANLLGPRSLDSFGSDWHRCQSRRLHPMGWHGGYSS